MSAPAKVLLFGGTSRIAARAINALVARNSSVMVLTGRPWDIPATPATYRPASGGGLEHALVELTTYDGTHTLHWQRRYDAIISVAPLKYVARVLDYLPDPAGTRAVFLSSNNAALLGGSADYADTRAAEDGVLSGPLDSVVLQPTAICGHSGDAVLGELDRRVRAGKTVWLPGARTRQTPVHFEDVADALLHALSADVPAGRYSVSGPEQADYLEMVRMLEAANGTQARTRPLPAAPIRMLGRLTRHPRGAQLRRAGIDRLPVNPSLPGFTPHRSIADMIASLSALP